MKKLLLPLLCLTLLTGCSKPSQEKEPVDPGEPEPSDPVDPEDPVVPEDPGDPTDPVDERERKTKKVTFLDGSFTGSLDLEKTQNNFVTWFNGEDDVLKGISLPVGDYAQINDVGGFVTMSLGAQAKAGNLTFSFNYDIEKITVNIQSYYKYVAYNNSYNNDHNSVFSLDCDTYDLSLESSFSG